LDLKYSGGGRQKRYATGKFRGCKKKGEKKKKGPTQKEEEEKINRTDRGCGCKKPTSKKREHGKRGKITGPVLVKT